ncbi:MAG: ATP-binding protein [Pirellulaceae bacterium]|nr:ATP-binding protein [Pirellulaceae bacterium]MDG2471091.1 ATP-binding protein [Pirellulaceae bacterium]
MPEYDEQTYFYSNDELPDTVTPKRIQFKVDIASIIDLMGKSLYSRLETPIRELIQNGHDAVLRRRQIDISFKGRIHVQQIPETGSIRFSDDGIGLTIDEAEKYLGTLGLGITGFMKGRGPDRTRPDPSEEDSNLIGEFGVGLFSAFMLAERLIVESRSPNSSSGVRWEAGPESEIEISKIERSEIGTSVELKLQEDYLDLCRDEEMIEESIKQFADFISVPIFLNEAKARTNLINAAWFDETPDFENLEMELASYFEEQPLDVIPIRCEKPISIAGAIYVSPQRTPGFSDDAVVAVTIRRMVISRRIQDLLPAWGSFFRGVLELHDCSPTASREDIVRDKTFELVQGVLEEKLFQHFEKQAKDDPRRLEALLDVHRYTLVGSAIESPRLRNLLRGSYKWTTSKGRLTFPDVIKQSTCDPLFESEADHVIWYNADRRQERWMNDLFRESDTVCIHTLRSFEETLLAAMIADSHDEPMDLRTASVHSTNFSASILGMSDLEEADSKWQEFFDKSNATIHFASFDSNQPAMAFLNERYELFQTMDELKKEGEIPHGFQRLIDQHFENSPTGKNEVVLNRNHRLIQSALKKSADHPLASVLRLLVVNALLSAGAKIDTELQRQQRDDLNWISEALDG